MPYLYWLLKIGVCSASPRGSTRNSCTPSQFMCRTFPPGHIPPVHLPLGLDIPLGTFRPFLPTYIAHPPPSCHSQLGTEWPFMCSCAVKKLLIPPLSLSAWTAENMKQKSRALEFPMTAETGGEISVWGISRGKMSGEYVQRGYLTPISLTTKYTCIISLHLTVTKRTRLQLDYFRTLVAMTTPIIWQVLCVTCSSVGYSWFFSCVILSPFTYCN